MWIDCKMKQSWNNEIVFEWEGLISERCMRFMLDENGKKNRYG